jgi:hypothetical protein
LIRCTVHPVEPAEERLDRPQPRAEDEVEREGRRSGEGAEHGDARERRELPREALVERRERAHRPSGMMYSTASTSGPRTETGLRWRNHERIARF